MFIRMMCPAIVRVGCLVPLWLFSSASVAEPPVWTLAASLQRAVEIAPEVRIANAEVAVREGELRGAGLWPVPTIDFRADQKLALEKGGNGLNLRYIALSQALPLSRLPHQQRAAEAQLEGERENWRYQHLLIDYQVAQTYHHLQLAMARYALAIERRDMIKQIVTRRDALVRYLAPAERVRLGILREQAEQAIAASEGELTEIKGHLRKLLLLPAAGDLKLSPLTPAPIPATLESFLEKLDQHPGVAALRFQQQGAQTNVAVARAQRYADPVVSVFGERDFIGGSERNYAGITLSIPLPLRGANNSAISKAAAESEAARARYDLRVRDLEANLYKSHLHLNHLIEQAEHHRNKVLEPGAQLFALIRKSFAAGEVNVLVLVDAYDNYFDARSRYLELLAQQWLESADLRLAAGQSPRAEVRP